MAGRQAVLGIDRGAFFYGASRVFSQVSFLLDDARTALVGENGAGKSTLLKCLTGELELNQGKVIASRGLRVAALSQEVPAHLATMSLRAVLERSLARAGAIGEDWRIDVLLDELCASQAAALAPFGALSGGWQRLMLIAAAAKLEDPDILILDEPTNYLDIANINTLESWLIDDITVPMLIVSHDREFLDRVTSRTLFLRSDGIHAFKAPFLLARAELLRRDATAAVQGRLEDKEIKRLEKVAARYKLWGVKNSKFHKREKATHKRIARIEADKSRGYAPRERRLELNDSDIEAKVALRLTGVTVTVPGSDRPLVVIDRLTIGAGDKVALLGVNGAGKSTLLTTLARAYDPHLRHYDGQASVRFNPACRLVYFDQTMADLPLDKSLLGFLTATQGATDRDAIRLLAQAGFAFARIGEPIRLLSHGERSRLIFLKMKLLAPNFYLLDEPTSHLDIEGQEDLESQLEETDVSCIFVSHDRYFTRAAATRFLEIRKGRLVEVENADAFFDAQG
ncbi:MAG TPA: ABC-F family ATP-binding cassette domain-containing protein [Caulobacteraceae bacterium]